MVKITKLDALVSHIVSLLDSNQQDDGVYRNTRWRMSGVATGVDMDGILELACADRFDRWANSSTIWINLEKISWEIGKYYNEKELEDIVRKGFAIYG